MRTKQEPHHFVDEHVGKRLRVKRRLLGLSQQEVAEKLDITFQQLQKYEKAYNRMSASRLYETALILGEPVNYFFEGLPGQGKQKAGGTMAERMLDEVAVSHQLKRETMELVRLFYSISDPAMRKRVKELLRIVIAARK